MTFQFGHRNCLFVYALTEIIQSSPKVLSILTTVISNSAAPHVSVASISFHSFSGDFSCSFISGTFVSPLRLHVCVCLRVLGRSSQATTLKLVMRALWGGCHEGPPPEASCFQQSLVSAGVLLWLCHVWLVRSSSGVVGSPPLVVLVLAPLGQGSGASPCQTLCVTGLGPPIWSDHASHGCGYNHWAWVYVVGPGFTQGALSLRKTSTSPRIPEVGVYLSATQPLPEAACTSSRSYEQRLQSGPKLTVPH